MQTFKTVDSPERITDPLIRRKKEDVSKMRASLLTCSEDPLSSITAMKNITVLRIYHQIARIIRYLEMMDKLEDKLYESLDNYIDNLDGTNTSGWLMLLNIQERLQKTMIESHKLLQPYLNVQEFNMKDLTVEVTESISNASTASLIDRGSRDRIRTSAQQVLAFLDSQGVEND